MIAKGVFAAIGKGGNELAKEREVVSLYVQGLRYFLGFISRTAPAAATIAATTVAPVAAPLCSFAVSQPTDSRNFLVISIKLCHREEHLSGLGPKAPGITHILRGAVVGVGRILLAARGSRQRNVGNRRPSDSLLRIEIHKAIDGPGYVR